MYYKTGDKQLIKEINRTSILKLIWDKEIISRAEIAKTLGLTPATISSSISELIKQGIVREAGMGDSSGGRKPVLVELDESGIFFIGVDIHKDGVKTAVVNIKGKIIHSVERIFQHLDDSVKEHVNIAISAVREKSGIPSEKLHGIGIGMHGIVDTSKDITLFVPSMAQRNVVVKPYVEQEQALPVIIDNDANAMAVGERWFGNAKGISDFVFVNAGKGIGSGIIFNGEKYYGKNYAAGEIGHIRISDNGLKCVCGKFGCLDTVATEHSLIRDVRGKLQTGVKSIMPALVGDDLGKISLNIIIEAAKTGDKCAVAALESVGRYIGVAMSYVINMLNPERIIIGGSLSRAGAFMLDPLLEAAQNLSMSESIAGVDIVPSALGENAGMIGAASMVIQKYLESTARIDTRHFVK